MLGIASCDADSDFILVQTALRGVSYPTKEKTSNRAKSQEF